MNIEDYKTLVDIVKRNGFNETIDVLMEANVISSIDILSIADEIYDNGENPIEQIDNIMDFERQRALNDPTESMISLEDMMHDIMFVYYDRDDIIKCFDDDELLDYLENSFELEKYVEDKVEEAEYDLRNEFDEEINKLCDALPNKKQVLKTFNLYDFNSDDVHTLICQLTNVNLYDKNTEFTIEKLKEILNNNTYNVKY